MNENDRKELAERLRSGKRITHDILQQAADVIDPPTPDGTMRVSARVYGDAHGRWIVSGGSLDTDDTRARELRRNEKHGYSHVLATLVGDVPRPTAPPVVDASVRT